MPTARARASRCELGAASPQSRPSLCAAHEWHPCHLCQHPFPRGEGAPFLRTHHAAACTMLPTMRHAPHPALTLISCPPSHSCRTGTPTSPKLPLYGAKGLAVRAGTLTLHGQHKTPTWSRLSSTANVGDSEIVVEGDLSTWEGALGCGGHPVCVQLGSLARHDRTAAILLWLWQCQPAFWTGEGRQLNKNTGSEGEVRTCRAILPLGQNRATCSTT